MTMHPGDRVTLNDPNFGTLRLIVQEHRPPTNGGPAWVTLTDPDGYGRWRRPIHELTPGWGN